MNKCPKFVTSPYFYIEDDGWCLKEGAPRETVEEFENYMKNMEEKRKEGVAV